MKALAIVLAAAVVFLLACFYWPTPEPRYRLMPDGWYKLDTRGIDSRG
jgi:hypothetical protein